MELFLQGNVPFRQILNGTTSLFLCLIWLMSGCQKNKTKNIIAFIIFIGIRWRALLSARSIAVCELPLSCFSLPAGRNKKQPLLLLLQELPCIKNTVSSNIWREKCKKLMKSSFKKKKMQFENPCCIGASWSRLTLICYSLPPFPEHCAELLLFGPLYTYTTRN